MSSSIFWDLSEAEQSDPMKTLPHDLVCFQPGMTSIDACGSSAKWLQLFGWYVIPQFGSYVIALYCTLPVDVGESTLQLAMWDKRLRVTVAKS